MGKKMQVSRIRLQKEMPRFLGLTKSARLRRGLHKGRHRVPLDLSKRLLDGILNGSFYIAMSALFVGGAIIAGVFGVATAPFWVSYQIPKWYKATRIRREREKDSRPCKPRAKQRRPRKRPRKQQKCALLAKLPLELRCQIWEAAIGGHEIEIVKPWRDEPKPERPEGDWLALLRTCQQV